MDSQCSRVLLSNMVPINAGTTGVKANFVVTPTQKAAIRRVVVIPTAGSTNFAFRIVDANGNVLFGPQTVTMSGNTNKVLAYDGSNSRVLDYGSCLRVDVTTAGTSAQAVIGIEVS